MILHQHGKLGQSDDAIHVLSRAEFFWSIRKSKIQRRTPEKHQAHLVVQLAIKSQKNFRGIVLRRPHEESGICGLIQRLRFPTPLRVIPVIATKRVG